ncbi:glycosyltransferase family 4 protein [Hydrogenimonas cancrithermarum]|uniref:Glycosyl transferase family 1 domain-containing protein n=1 Tax=Hydrogenimonas cancrithermarum TaxID=2993563 RepID=A0ABM8FNX6_9BACT|nr:glycosyltransferase family 4 protein [Hydrogenimonas cancrithermarum]BDY13538.1 hypothetical protein HCR_18500 [Hydrogenimonas cancrithermarum]
MSLKTFAFLVEPSSYTLDIVENIYKPLGIGHIFFHDRPLIAQSDKTPEGDIFENMGCFQRIAKLRNIWRRYDFFIFNGYNTTEFLLFFLTSWILGGRKYIAIDSDTQYKEIGGIKRFVKKLYLQTIFKRSFVLGFAGGSYGHKELFRRYGMAEERIFLMPMMVNNETFFANRPKPESPFTFLYVGRIIPHKNVEMLIQSFQKAFGDETTVFLRIVGRGSSLESLKSRYADAPNIHFEGAKFGRNLVEAYHTSHLLVIPSLYEPWGLVVNEALSAGLPVLASNRVGAIYDLILGKETGFVFDPTNIDELSSLMKKIYEDPLLYKKMSRNAEELMRNSWNYEMYKTNLISAIDYCHEKLHGEER